MKISLKWLNEYVDVSEYFAQPEALAQKLTSVGLEVEAIENAAKNFNHVVVGRIVELGQHPNADKLTLCQVDVGDGKIRQIVCGAKNHKQGDKIVVALPGAVLPGDFAIKISKIRDVESQGMLCSESELGLKEKSDGILILPSDATVGLSYADYSGRNDVFFEINVTPNRADCLSHVGLAREISCLTKKVLHLPKTEIKGAGPKTTEHIDVELLHKELCSRFSGRSVFRVKVGPSPNWLKERVESVGLNSVNNIVDVTNFVMMEFGQPLHAYDADQLTDKKIVIDKARFGEKFKSFDGTELTLVGNELTIRDGARVVGLAGVVGGLNSGVTETTQNIFIEAAHFSPKGVRRTSRQHGVDTDAAHRFSRGTDPENIVMCLNRAVQLVQDVAGGDIAQDFYDIYPEPQSRATIQVRRSVLEERLGYSVNMIDFAQWMERLHCEIVERSDDLVLLKAPPFRVDIEMEMDLVEEYGRLNGYDKIPETFPALETAPTDSVAAFVYSQVLSEQMVAQGFHEARNFHFINPKWQSQICTEKAFSMFGLSAGGSAVDIQNPLSEEISQMRQSLVPGLLTNAFFNFHHGVQVGRLFEIGAIFGRTADGYIEHQRLAGVIWGRKKSLWENENRFAVYDLKSALEGLFRHLRGVPQWRVASGPEIPAFLHPGQSAQIFYEGQAIGFIGALHPAFREEQKVRTDVAVFEMDATALVRGQPRLAKIKVISKFPTVERDFALLVPNELPVGDIQREIEKTGAPFLQSSSIFDVFSGNSVPEGFRSVAFRLLLQDQDGTLSEDMLNQTSQKILNHLDKKFGIKPRE